MNDSLQEPLKVSACMMVKNEEKLLPGCLESIRDHVDEIVVVDTGSTDHTINIAESFGAKIYHHPWEHHFSKHRNQSLDYATGDWILIIDADEELLPLRNLSLHQALQTANDIDSVLIPVECASPMGMIQANSVRFFRNHRGIHYQGRVHNYLVGITRSLFLDKVRLFHHGYNLGQEVDEKKFKRSTELLKLDILDDPKNPRPHHFLAASYMSQNMYALASESAERAIYLFEKTKMVHHNYFWSLYIAAASYHELGEDGKAETFSHKAISLFPEHLDSHFVLCSVYVKRNDRVLFEKHRDAYLTIHEAIQANPSTFGEIVHNTWSAEWLVHLWAGVMALTANKTSVAEELLQLGRRGADSDIRFFQETSRLLQRKKGDSDSENTGLKLTRSLLTMGEYDSIGDITRDILLKSGVTPEEAHRISALYHYHMGDHITAIRDFERTIEFDPNQLEPYAYIAKMAVDNLDVEICIEACDHLLRILALDRNIELQSLSELGGQFFGIAEALIKTSEIGPAKLCVDIGRSLTKMGSEAQDSSGDNRLTL